MQAKKNKSKRFREAKTLCKFREIKKEISKAQKTNKGTTTSSINKILSCAPHFIGCYSENEIEKIKLNSFPCFIIINLDHDKLPGSHWIALHFTRKSIEIWDSLGFRLLSWPTVPCSLLNYLQSHTVSRKILVSKRMQSDSSVLCGFYCILFVICRPFMSFSSLVNLFSSNLAVNDKILIKFFS